MIIKNFKIKYNPSQKQKVSIINQLSNNNKDNNKDNNNLKDNKYKIKKVIINFIYYLL